MNTQRKEKMECPNCHKPKTKEDFYWNKGTGFKADSDCKQCIHKRYEAKKEETKKKKADPLYQYFN